MNMKMMSLVACCLLAFAATPVDAQTIQSRTFTDPFSVGLAFGDGAGIFDPNDPTNTCIALLSIDVGLSAVLLFYLNGRTVVEGPGHEQAVPGTPFAPVADPTDCAGLANPGNQIGTDAAAFTTGGYVVQSPILSGAHLPATEAWGLNLCSIGGSPIITVGESVDCTNPVAIKYGVGVLASGWSESTYFLNAAETATNPQISALQLPDSGMINSFVAADVFDGIMSFVSVSDSDYFGALEWGDTTKMIADAAGLGLNTDAIDTATISLDPTLWSEINVNLGGLGTALTALSCTPNTFLTTTPGMMIPDPNGFNSNLGFTGVVFNPGVGQVITGKAVAFAHMGGPLGIAPPVEVVLAPASSVVFGLEPLDTWNVDIDYSTNCLFTNVPSGDNLNFNLFG